MIPSAAVEDYLARDLDSHLWMKELSEEEVDRALESLNPSPWIWPGDAQNPEGTRLHQKVSILLGIAYPGFGYFLDMGCVDGDTEYLTPTGWNRIADYKSGAVAQYDPMSRVATFVLPTRYIRRPCREMYHFKTERGCDQMVSGGHKMLVVGGYNGVPNPWRSVWKHTPVAPLDEYRSEKDGNTPWFFDVSPSDVAGRTQVRFETTFLYDGPGIDLSESDLRVQVAVHADGYLYCKSKVAVNVKKERKKERMRWLLADAGILYKERVAGNGYSCFTFRAPRHTKKYGSNWWMCSLRQKEIICSEVVHWDGSVGKANSSSFYSRSRSCADFIQFCFSSTRRRAYMNTEVKPRVDGGRDYSVHAIGTGRTTNLAHLRGAERVPAPDGKMYCFEVPTGYLVLRRNGNIFITGNSGKTLVALTLLRYWWDTGAIRRALIFVTSDKAFLTWEKQIRRFGIGLPYTALEGPSEDKWRTLDEVGEGLVLVTRPGAVAMVSQKVTVKKKGKKPKPQLKLVDAKVTALAKWAGALVYDESTREANFSSLQFRLADKLRKATPRRYLLAGRPFGRDPTMLVPQYKLIDDGETLGETLGLFRAVFCTESENVWDPKGYAKDYTFRKDMHGELSRIIQHRSITYTADECVDLPDVVPIVEEVSFPTEAQSYYKRVVTDLIKSRGNYRAAKNAFLRMRQVSSGFVGVHNDETGAKAEIEFAENPKLDRLLELIEDLPEGRGAVIFYQFTHTGRRIVQELRAMDLDPIWLWSGTKDARGDFQRFGLSERPIAVIQGQLGSMSIDGLQERANYLFFMESPLSLIDREQAEHRLVRTGQEHTVFIYDFIVRGSIDARILEYYREGQALIDAILRDPSIAAG